MRLMIDKTIDACQAFIDRPSILQTLLVDQGESPYGHLIELPNLFVLFFCSNGFTTPNNCFQLLVFFAAI